MCEMLPRPCTQRFHLARLPAHSSFNKRVLLARPSANATHAMRIRLDQPDFEILRQANVHGAPKPNVNRRTELYRKRSTKCVLPNPNLKQFKREQFGVSNLRVLLLEKS